MLKGEFPTNTFLLKKNLNIVFAKMQLNLLNDCIFIYVLQFHLKDFKHNAQVRLFFEDSLPLKFVLSESLLKSYESYFYLIYTE